MTGQKGIPIVGGPLDGQRWPTGASVPSCSLEQGLAPLSIGRDYPIRKPVETPAVDYSLRTMRQPLGQIPSEIKIYVPSDWSTEQIEEHLNRHHPHGIA